MICTMMIPTQIILVPQYIIYNKLGFVGTYLPLILPHFFGQAFFIYQMMQFGAGIPKDLDEAAIIDGCSKYTIFTKIFLPLLKPSIVNHDHHSVLLEVGRFHVADDLLKQAQNVHGFRGHQEFCGFHLYYGLWRHVCHVHAVTDSGIPDFPVFNRYLVEGISTSGIKG